MYLQCHRPLQNLFEKIEIDQLHVQASIFGLVCRQLNRISIICVNKFSMVSRNERGLLSCHTLFAVWISPNCMHGQIWTPLIVEAMNPTNKFSVLSTKSWPSAHIIHFRFERSFFCSCHQFAPKYSKVSMDFIMFAEIEKMRLCCWSVLFSGNLLQEFCMILFLHFKKSNGMLHE